MSVLIGLVLVPPPVIVYRQFVELNVAVTVGLLPVQQDPEQVFTGVCIIPHPPDKLTVRWYSIFPL
jgi:hypothetical protein